MAQATQRYALALHGGAGAYDKAGFNADQLAAYRRGLARALEAGEMVLARDGAALDAVCAAVAVLEDDPLFNAGRGAVFTNEGKVELDAAAMDGATLRAGAVAGARTTRNPVRLARAILDHSPHVMLHGRGADAFAALHGLSQVDNSYFHTPFRLAQLRAAQAAGAAITLGKFGTVGAVACDRAGDLAAATSTGGLTNKQFGRVGDSPIIGAGTYANNAGCAVSATGHGEYFIRLTLARDISALMEMKGLPLEAAANLMVKERLRALGGEGGVIAVDRQGELVLVFNTAGMFRAGVREGEAAWTAIMADDAKPVQGSSSESQ
ncbi:MAG: isoaspartyl peptidase/L-asparaginase family protein [Pseudomonadota bacterium]